MNWQKNKVSNKTLLYTNIVLTILDILYTSFRTSTKMHGNKSDHKACIWW